MHNALRPNSNKDGCHYLSFEEAAIIMAPNPARERNEHGLFLFFDNFKLLLSTISTFGEAERYINLGFEDIDQAADRLITAAIDPELEDEIEFVEELFVAVNAATFRMSLFCKFPMATRACLAMAHAEEICCTSSLHGVKYRNRSEPP